MKLLFCLIAALAISSVLSTISPPVFLSNSEWVTAHMACFASCKTDFLAKFTPDVAGNYGTAATKTEAVNILGKLFIEFDGAVLAPYVAVKDTTQKNKVDGTLMEEQSEKCKYLDTIPKDNVEEYYAASVACLPTDLLDSSLALGASTTIAKAELKFNNKEFNTATPPALVDADITYPDCMVLCNEGKFAWKTDSTIKSYPKEQIMYEVAVKTEVDCKKDCHAEKKALYTSYEQEMASFWNGLVTTCEGKYTVSGKISQDRLGDSIPDEMLDDENQKIENTNACFLLRGAGSFVPAKNWSAEYYASMKSCNNFCKESTMVGQGDRTNAYLDVLYECDAKCAEEFEKEVKFDGDVETKFEESSSSVLSVSLALLALVAFFL